MSPNEKIIYLDNAATTFPKPEVVYQAMDDFYRNYGGNAGRGANPLARKATLLVEETRALVREWLDAKDVVFTPSATIALNTVIQGAGLRQGDVVYVTPFEHNSVLRPLEHLRRKFGIEIRLIPFDLRDFGCNLQKAEELFRIEPPTMVCVTLISNVFGNILPVKDILSKVKAANSETIAVVDAAQGAGLHQVNMPQTDALVFSGHKSLYGPFGVAGIAFGTGWRPEPILMGGTGTNSESTKMPDSGGARFEAGSQNILAIAGLNASIKWLAEVGKGTINRSVKRLSSELTTALEDIRAVRIYGDSSSTPNSGVVSFTVDGISPQSVEAALGASSISVRSGLHCAPWAHDWAGTLEKGGTTRLSPGYFNTISEVAELSVALATICDALMANIAS